MTLKDRALRAVAIKVVSDAMKDLVGQEREDFFTELCDFYDATGAKSLDVKLPDGTKVGGISIAIAKEEAQITDRDALKEWVMQNNPTAVVTIPQRQDIADAYLDALLKKVTFTDDGTALTEDGEVVPGVTKNKGGYPKSFSIRPSSDGKAAIAQAWADGQLAQMLPGIAPALPAGDDE